MRRLVIISLLLVLGACGIIKDAMVPDIPKGIADHQNTANVFAAEVLVNLRLWLDSPEQIPVGAANTTHLKIHGITRHLTEVRNWMLVDDVDKKVSQTVIDLLVAWRDYIDAKFCVGNEAWLDKPVPMSADDNSTWFQVFFEMESLHEKLQVWMEHKGVIDG